jgi:hypothetical protein
MIALASGQRYGAILSYTYDRNTVGQNVAANQAKAQDMQG